MKFVIKSIFVMFAIVCCFDSSQLWAQATEIKVTLDQVPADVKNAIQKAVGAGKLIDIGEIISNGKSSFEIEMQVRGTEIDVTFDAQGNELSRSVDGDVGAPMKQKEEAADDEEDDDDDDDDEEGDDDDDDEEGDDDDDDEEGDDDDDDEEGDDDDDEEEGDDDDDEEGGDDDEEEGDDDDDDEEGDDDDDDEEGDDDDDDEEGDDDDDDEEGDDDDEEEGDDDDEEGDDDDDDEESDESAGSAFQHAFDLEHRELATTGRNRFFVLEPGYQLILAGKDGKHDAELEIIVLDETKEIGGIPTRVVEEREKVDGELVEISRNYFAICKQTGSVFYFGEDVDIYRDGKVVDHEGAWLHGKDNAQAGMMMPGECVVGAAYYQEYAPKQAMDRARIQDLNASIKTPAGEFSACLKVWEEDPLDSDAETKTFAPGIGIVQDEGLLLRKHGFINK